jgi:hypothetical protein
MSTLALRLLLAAILLLACLPAFAQPAQCGSRAAILRSLAVQYGEAIVGTGINHAGRLVEILTGPTGTWTIIVTQANGPTCLVTSGDGWIFHPPVTPEKGA